MLNTMFGGDGPHSGSESGRINEICVNLQPAGVVCGGKEGGVRTTTLGSARKANRNRRRWLTRLEVAAICCRMSLVIPPAAYRKPAAQGLKATETLARLCHLREWPVTARQVVPRRMLRSEGPYNIESLPRFLSLSWILPKQTTAVLASFSRSPVTGCSWPTNVKLYDTQAVRQYTQPPVTSSPCYCRGGRAGFFNCARPGQRRAQVDTT
jgi:hypothetical protein